MSTASVVLMNVRHSFTVPQMRGYLEKEKKVKTVRNKPIVMKRTYRLYKEH